MMSHKKKDSAAETLKILKVMYPDAECALTHSSPWQLLCATILSAQCTDVRVNMVTPNLFAAYPTAESLACAQQEDIEKIVQSTGFFRQKTKSLISMSQDIISRFNGELPQTIEELTSLRGVGRKTANVIIGVAFGGDGVVVDTHVKRLSKRIGWTKQTDPVKIEQELMYLFPRNDWTLLGHTLIWHGRTVCMARSPKCMKCPINNLCKEGIKRMTAYESAANEKIIPLESVDRIKLDDHNCL